MNMSPHPASDLVLRLHELHSHVQKRISNALSLHGIGLSEYMVLRQLHTAPHQKLGRSELASLVGLTPSGVTRLLNPMEKIGLVAKEDNPRDARVSWVRLSDAGQRIYQDAQTSFAQAAEALFAQVPSAALSKLLDGVKDASPRR